MTELEKGDHIDLMVRIYNARLATTETYGLAASQTKDLALQRSYLELKRDGLFGLLDPSGVFRPHLDLTAIGSLQNNLAITLSGLDRHVAAVSYHASALRSDLSAADVNIPRLALYHLNTGQTILDQYLANSSGVHPSKEEKSAESVVRSSSPDPEQPHFAAACMWEARRYYRSGDAALRDSEHSIRAQLGLALALLLSASVKHRLLAGQMLKDLEPAVRQLRSRGHLCPMDASTDRSSKPQPRASDHCPRSNRGINNIRIWSMPSWSAYSCSACRGSTSPTRST